MSGGGSGASGQKLCPSARCTAGTHVIGVIGHEGMVAHISPSLSVDDATVGMLGENPEDKFRFAGRCLRGGCLQWRAGRCGVADQALTLGERSDLTEEHLPICAIRPECVWYSQAGRKACQICPQVHNRVWRYSPPK
jgi:hypothetical protein